MRFFRAVIGVIFGLVFAAVGGFIAFETAVPAYARWVEMQTWQATEGGIVEAGGEANNVTASYRYTVAGTQHRGARVYLTDFKDNIGSYHIDMRRHLTGLQRAGQPVTVWFDPDNPVDSVIDRDMRWGLFALISGFCAVFIIFGLTVAIASLKTKKATTDNHRVSLTQMRHSWKTAREKGEFNGGFIDYARSYPKRRSASSPEYSDPLLQPWLNNPHWRSTRLRSTAKRGMHLMWAFAILWNLVSAPLLFVLGDELQRQNYAILLGLLFPLVGVVLLKKAWDLTREWRRFGVIELELDPFPGAIGGHVGGRLLIDGIYQSAHRYEVELACVHSYVAGSGKNRSRRENILWSEKGLAHAEIATSPTGTGTRLSFRFDVPDDLPESDVRSSGDYHLWRVRLSARFSDVDLQRDYTIPVFRTEDRVSSIPHDLSAQAMTNRTKAVAASKLALSAGQLDQTALSRAVRFSEQGGVTRFYYPMLRNKMLTLFALIFAAGFGFASYSMLTHFGTGAMGIMIALFSLPFAIVGLLATVAAVYLPLNNLRVAIGNGTLRVTRRLFIVPIKRRQVATHEITRLEVERSGSSGQGGGKIEHFKISAHTKDGRKITIAEDVDGEALATAFKAFLERKLGIAASRSR